MTHKERQEVRLSRDYVEIRLPFLLFLQYIEGLTAIRNKTAKERMRGEEWAFPYQQSIILVATTPFLR